MTNIQRSPMNKKRKPKIRVFPHPVDSGWSWVTLAGSFVLFVTFGGILRSFGIFMVEFLEVYNADSTSSSLIIGLQFAVSGITGFLVMTVGLKFFTARQLIITGGFVGSIGLIINTFADSVYFFILSHSILAGTSIGFINGPCLFSLGKYFDTKRSLANGITLSGVSFGGLFMGPLSRYLIDTYGLKGAFLIIGAMYSHTIAAGALIRPDSFYKVEIKRKRKISDTKNQSTGIKQTQSRQSSPKSEISSDMRQRKISDTNSISISVEKQSPSETNGSSLGNKVLKRNMNEPSESHRTRKISEPARPDMTKQQRSRKISDPVRPDMSQRSRKISDTRKPESVSLLEEHNEQLDGFRPRSPTSDSFSPLARKAMLQRMRSRTESEVVQLDITDQNLTKSGNINSSEGDIPNRFQKPSSKKNFYVSSEFLFDISTAEIIQAISLESISSEDKSSSKKKETKPTIIIVLRYLCNCTLFKDIPLIIFLIGYFIGSIGCFYPIVYIPPLGDSHGIDKTRMSVLIAISSAIDVFGRAGSGFLADRGFISRKQIMITVLVICGLLNCLNSFYDEYWSLIVFSIIYGAIGGTIFAINTSTLSEIVEVERLGQAVGLMVGGQQLSLGIFGPFCGALRDLTGSYEATFYFLGVSCVLGALLIALSIILFNLKKNKENLKNETNIEIQ